jgi:hypothetical protein
VRSLPRVDGSIAAHDVPLPRSLHACRQPARRVRSACAETRSRCIARIADHLRLGKSSWANNHSRCGTRRRRRILGSASTSPSLLAGSNSCRRSSGRASSTDREELTEPEERASPRPSTLAPTAGCERGRHAAAVAARRQDHLRRARRAHHPAHPVRAGPTAAGRRGGSLHLAAGDRPCGCALAALRGRLPPGRERAGARADGNRTTGGAAVIRLCEAAVDEAGAMRNAWSRRTVS